MHFLIVKSWLLLVYVDCLMRFRDFKQLQLRVRQEECMPSRLDSESIDDLCHAVNLACVFYFKPVLCLQRSAVTTIMLRRQGWQAEMVIGVQLLPFRSHAWVEFAGNVVNDKPYTSEIFQILERW